MLKKYNLLPLLTATLLLSSFSSVSAGRAFFSSCMTGTYLITEGNGTKSLWTLTSDGTIIGSSSAQKNLNFSTQHGSWFQSGRKAIRAVLLDFSYNENNELKSIARVDIIMNFLDISCRHVSGEFSVRFFDSNEDPLAPWTDTGEAVTDSFTGELVRPAGPGLP